MLFLSRCEENPFCKWFSFDDRKGLCYLKDRRGYLSNSSSRFTSGATFRLYYIRYNNTLSGAVFRDGCEPDPPCGRPYTWYDHQCLYSPPGPGSYLEAGALCDTLGGHLVTTYEDWWGEVSRGEAWHWVDAREGEAGTCWACRPSHWGRGVSRLPCTTQLPFSCQRRRLFPPPLTPTPLINNNIDDAPILDEIISNDINPRTLVIKKRSRYLGKRRKFMKRNRYFANPFLNLAFGENL